MFLWLKLNRLSRLPFRGKNPRIFFYSNFRAETH